MFGPAIELAVKYLGHEAPVLKAHLEAVAAYVGVAEASAGAAFNQDGSVNENFYQKVHQDVALNVAAAIAVEAFLASPWALAIGGYLAEGLVIPIFMPMMISVGFSLLLGGGLVWGLNKFVENNVFGIPQWVNITSDELLDDLADLLRHFRSDPLVIDLDGNGIDLISLDSSTTPFDIDGDGAIERVGWVGPNDGLLVLDANQNGIVDGVEELIGNTHIDGFDELASMDANNDGVVDQLDTDFSNLLVWRDTNGDGVSDASEMLTMAQAGIAGFNLSYTVSGAETGGNVTARVGSYVRTAGGQRALASVQFATDESVTRPVLDGNDDLGDIAFLPILGGHGPIADLRTSMFYDLTLKNLVEDLVNGG